MSTKWENVFEFDKEVVFVALEDSMYEYDPRYYHVFRSAIESLGGKLGTGQVFTKIVGAHPDLIGPGSEVAEYSGDYPDDALVFEMAFPPIAYITMEFRGFTENGDLVFVSLDGELDDPYPGQDWVIPLKDMVRFTYSRRPVTPAAKQFMADLTGSK